MEYMRLRIKDMDFEHKAIEVREGKGGEDHITLLPEPLIVPLKCHLVIARFSARF